MDPRRYSAVADAPEHHPRAVQAEARVCCIKYCPVLILGHDLTTWSPSPTSPETRLVTEDVEGYSTASDANMQHQFNTVTGMPVTLRSKSTTRFLLTIRARCGCGLVMADDLVHHRPRTKTLFWASL